MARKIVDIGAIGNDGTGDSIRDSFRKTNDNFKELYSSLGLGEKLTFIASIFYIKIFYGYSAVSIFRRRSSFDLSRVY